MRKNTILFLIALICSTVKLQAITEPPISNHIQEKYDLAYLAIENGLANNAV